MKIFALVALAVLLSALLAYQGPVWPAVEAAAWGSAHVAGAAWGSAIALAGSLGRNGW